MKTVLIVDDDRSSRTILAYGVERCGYHSVVASSGSEAIKMLDAHRCDLVLSDIVMEQGSGLELTSYIKESKHKDIPIVLVSSTIDSNVINTGLVSGAKDFVTKPINQEELGARLGKYLD